jgi:lycopene beta-cyclase
VPAYERCVGDWLSMRLDLFPTIEKSDEEHGVLPMGRILPQAGARLHCGMSGGTARMSTGYSFLGIQRQTRYLANALTTGKMPETRIPYSRRAQWMDRIFLEVARRNPRSLIDLFMKMASALDGDDFAKFMNDQGGLIPCVKTILAAPKQPFIRALGTMARA